MTIPENLSRLVFTVPAFVSTRFCSQLITRGDQSGYETATITTENGAVTAPDIRNNDRIIFDDHDLAAMLWNKAKRYFDGPFKGYEPIKLNERFRLYKYHQNQFFDWHQDGEYQSDDGLCSKFTMMIYLNEGCVGGNTSFADVFSPQAFKDFSIRPFMGSALFFHHPIAHRGDPIISGEKIVLRTDVMFKEQTALA